MHLYLISISILVLMVNIYYYVCSMTTNIWMDNGYIGTLLYMYIPCNDYHRSAIH